MASIILNQNDTGFDLSFTVRDSTGAAYDLTGTVKFFISDEKYVTKLDGDCVVTDALNGLCKYPLVAGDLDFRLEIISGNYSYLQQVEKLFRMLAK